MQAGHEKFVREIGTITTQEIEHLHEPFMLAGDTRDVFAARDSLKYR
jgi:hypothetical protein